MKAIDFIHSKSGAGDFPLKLILSLFILSSFSSAQTPIEINVTNSGSTYCRVKYALAQPSLVLFAANFVEYLNHSDGYAKNIRLVNKQKLRQLIPHITLDTTLHY